MQSVKNRGGAELINPQDFADIIRALPVRGEVDHEWHIYFDDTKPASLYGGTWEELAQGTFIMAAGDGGTAGQTGGSNTHQHTGEYLFGMILGLSDRTSARLRSSGAWKPTQTALTGWDEGVSSDWGYTSGIEIGGQTGFASNVPTNISAHIWKRVS